MIIRLRKKLNIVTHTATTEKVRSNLKLAWKEYKEISKSHATKRKTFLESLASARAEEGNTKRSSELKALIHREDQRRVARKIKRTLKKTKGSGTTKIIVQTEEGKVEVTKQSEMTAHIEKENIAKFHQTEGWIELHE